MKIKSVDVMQLNLEGLDSFRPVICRINTDEGIYGYGEAAIAYGVGAPGAFGMLQDFAKQVIGMDPFDSEKIWEKLFKTTFWGQGGGPITFAAISAIDIAIWDIKGKALGVPLYKLLGGKTNDKLRTYASQLQYGWSEDAQIGWGIVVDEGGKTENYVRNAKKAVAEGYDCIKIDFINYNREGKAHDMSQLTKPLKQEIIKLGEERLRAVREAVGEDVDIILENHCGTDAVSAIQIGQMAEKYNIYYYEEPVTPLNSKLTKYVADNVNIPIAQGERVFGRWGYVPFFEDLSIQVIQPDIGNMGGISEAKKVCEMAHAYDISVQTHVCGSPIYKAASLHLETAIPNFLIHEHHVVNIHPSMVKTCIHDYQPKEGYYTAPEIPGIGNELTKETINNATKVTIR
ncbi:mandelate racemase/muconate lactonizing enzyme family protein [Amphibacillus sp. Q70]|uniref:mandelate racemase/muconate lactonizing enzyme family protein n=1 Tax=Amphibacillus sp. Q70 TaxID=3453416 RepID=UPI003F838B6B